MIVCWGISPCSLVERNRRFTRFCCLHHQGQPGNPHFVICLRIPKALGFSYQLSYLPLTVSAIVKKTWTAYFLLAASSSSSLGWQPYVGPGLPQKLPAIASSDFVTSLFQGGVVNSTPKPWLSWRADVFYQGCIPQLTSPNFKASGSRFLPMHDLAV
jgi:hypothetical protein